MGRDSRDAHSRVHYLIPARLTERLSQTLLSRLPIRDHAPVFPPSGWRQKYSKFPPVVSVLTGSVAVLAAVPLMLHQALKFAGWPAPDRRQVVWSGALLLVAWYLAALLPSWLGFYGGVSSRIPTIQYGLLIPIVAGVALFWRWPALRRVIEAVPQEWIVSLQVYRALGLIFLVLYAGGHLPAEFAWPAGAGDSLVGLLAPAVDFAYARSHNAASLVRAWNLLGIADLIVAMTGFLTAPSPLQKLALATPNELSSAFPLAMIPVFMVPLSVLLHFASLQKLGHTKTGRPVPHTLFAGDRG